MTIEREEEAAIERGGLEALRELEKSKDIPEGERKARQHD